MRDDGIGAYGTMDAGANVHVICQPESEDAVAERLENLDIDLSLIRDGVGAGPVTEDEHLF